MLIPLNRDILVLDFYDDLARCLLNHDCVVGESHLVLQYLLVVGDPFFLIQ